MQEIAMDDHYIDMVNQKDEVIGKELKSKKPALGFISRVVAIMITDKEGKFIVCKRSPKKLGAANQYDLAAVGNVNCGESYEDAAQRELKEELQISCPLKMLDKFYQEINHTTWTAKIFCAVFLGKTDQEPKLNEELTEFKRMTFEEIEKAFLTRPEDFCPGFINDFNKVKNKLRS